MEQTPRVLILGHSFVKRFNYFLNQGRDKRTVPNLNLPSVDICVYGIGGRTVAKIRAFDLERVRAFQPHIVVLEVGSNDLCDAGQRPETIGSNMEDLLRIFQEQFKINIVVVC